MNDVPTPTDIDDIDALFGQAVEHYRHGRFAEALTLYDAVVRSKPDAAAVHCNRAFALQSLSRFDEALLSYDRAIALQPDVADLHFNKALLLKNLNRADAALQSCDRAIRLQPDHAGALDARGLLLVRLKRPQEALQSFERAIRLKPDFAAAHYNKANLLYALECLEEALQSYDLAIALRPDVADAHNNRGNVLQELKRPAEALRSYDRAIALEPVSLAWLNNKAMCALMLGDWERGWPLYEWRKKRAAPAEVRNSSEPEWTGKENLEGKTLLIHAEQGLGDTIQFCRYAPLAREKGARVILGVPDRLARLLKSLSPEIDIVPFTAAAPPAFDMRVALMSMPLAFGTTPGNCPAKAPYLRAEPERVAKWRERIGSEGLKIGICWQGDKELKADAGRSFPLRHFEGIARLPNIRLIGLQKNDGVEQLADLPSGMNVESLGEDFDAGPDAFIDTAAVMQCLDLVVTSDTAIAHLAGALARPVWVALKHVPDWRWMLDRADSPWYPTMKLFRQPARGDWTSVFAAIRAELAEQTS